MRLRMQFFMPRLLGRGAGDMRANEADAVDLQVRLHNLVSLKLFHIHAGEPGFSDVDLCGPRQMTAIIQQWPDQVNNGLCQADEVKLWRRFHMLHEEPLASRLQYPNYLL